MSTIAASGQSSIKTSARMSTTQPVHWLTQGLKVTITLAGQEQPIVVVVTGTFCLLTCSGWLAQQQCEASWQCADTWWPCTRCNWPVPPRNHCHAAPFRPAGQFDPVVGIPWVQVLAGIAGQRENHGVGGTDMLWTSQLHTVIRPWPGLKKFYTCDIFVQYESICHDFKHPF